MDSNGSFSPIKLDFLRVLTDGTGFFQRSHLSISEVEAFRFRFAQLRIRGGLQSRFLNFSKALF